MATKALVDGFHEADVGLNLGHAALREGISAEAQRPAAIKEAAHANCKAALQLQLAAKLAGAQGAAHAPGGQGPQGPLGAHLAPPPAQDGQGLQQAAQESGRAGPADVDGTGVPLARKAGPRPIANYKARGAGPSVAAAQAAQKKRPTKKKTKKKKPLWGLKGKR